MSSGVTQLGDRVQRGSSGSGAVDATGARPGRTVGAGGTTGPGAEAHAVPVPEPLALAAVSPRAPRTDGAPRELRAR
ncbi:hypothetical protein [Streptomyces sp. NPDC056983]|uniref:hypothetical protein n=1 Tax=Streptomyces sp. NPDC056983 TaxID=3345987 RepID=UPI003642F975